MTEEIKDKKEVDEKRVKKTVIRRRAKPAPVKEAAPAPSEETPAVVETTAAEESSAQASVVKKAAPAEKIKKADEVKTAAAKKDKAPEKKAAAPVDVAAAEAKAAQEGVSKKKAAKKAYKSPEKKKVEEAKVQALKKAKKEVTVVDFAEDQKKYNIKSIGHVGIFSKGKGRGRRKQQGPRPRKNMVQATRPLMQTEITTPKAEKQIVKISEAISVTELSQKMGVKAGDIIKKLMDIGIMATVNQMVDFESAQLVAGEFDVEVENVAIGEDQLIDTVAEVEVEGGVEFITRPPVVTVMGHVDHGKTSLLDAIRQTNVTSGESGGITQHIGAYHVHLDKGDITFLDTPGHEAFTAMRARGAGATDIVILVVAANDGVMPQTIEAITHAKAAGVPIIVAINKVDLEDANPDRVKQMLTEYELVPEDWGGSTIFVEVSAKAKTNITQLLEMVILQSEVLELKAPVDVRAQGVVVEARLDKGRGPVATVLVQNGVLKKGDVYVVGKVSGRVRALVSDWGEVTDSAGPSMPVEIVGLSGVPNAGDIFNVVKDEATARQIAQMRIDKEQKAISGTRGKVSLEDLFEQIKEGEVKEIDLILKGDVQGSVEALKDSLLKLSTEKVTVNVMHTAVGGISEGDVMLASASNAIIVGFHVRPEQKAKHLAEAENVDIRLYDIIYDVVEDVRNAMEGMLTPLIKEDIIGRVEIREVFKISRLGNIAGCFVTEGKITRASHIRLIRDNVVIFEGDLSTLKRFKDDAKEVMSGFECGLTIQNFNDIKVGDVVEPYILREEADTL